MLTERLTVCRWRSQDTAFLDFKDGALFQLKPESANWFHPPPHPPSTNLIRLIIAFCFEKHKQSGCVCVSVCVCVCVCVC